MSTDPPPPDNHRGGRAVPRRTRLRARPRELHGWRGPGITQTALIQVRSGPPPRLRNSHHEFWTVWRRAAAMNGITGVRPRGQGSRHVIPFRCERVRLRPGFCLGRPSHDGYSAALCARPRHSLDHHPVLFCPARHRS